MKRTSFKTPLFFIKIFHFEYWPYWIFYIPIVPYMFWHALKARSLTFYTSVNPSIALGGIIGESKIEILRNIDPKYIPGTIFIQQHTSAEEVLKRFRERNFSYPVICKPDRGERGNDVEKVIDEKGLLDYLNKINADFLVQAYIPYDTELGVFYYRLPDGSAQGITSIVQKGFLELEGDGESTVLELLEANTRARFVLDNLKEKLGNDLQVILKKGEKFYPQPIGNHCKGTKFINANHLINDQLVEVFDVIASSMKEFYYGRFDIRVKSIDDLYRGENIYIMEVNGITSEPGHIYDPEMKLLKAYRDMYRQVRILYAIGTMNKKRGYAYAKFTEVVSTIRYYKNK